MDTLGQPKKKTRDPHKTKIRQKRYRQHKYAVFNGMEEVRAHHRQRYFERMARMKAAGEYEAFKAKKSKEGMRRYHVMSEEQRNEVKRKNLILQKAWRNRMFEEGTYEAYRQRLNARRRELMAEKKRAMGVEEWTFPFLFGYTGCFLSETALDRFLDGLHTFIGCIPRSCSRLP